MSDGDPAIVTVSVQLAKPPGRVFKEDEQVLYASIDLLARLPDTGRDRVMRCLCKYFGVTP